MSEHALSNVEPISLARRLLARPDTPVRLFSAIEPLALLLPAVYVASGFDDRLLQDTSYGALIACLGIVLALMLFGLASRALDRTPSQLELLARAVAVLAVGAYVTTFAGDMHHLVWWVTVLGTYTIAMSAPTAVGLLLVGACIDTLTLHGGGASAYSELAWHQTLSALIAAIGYLLGTTMARSHSQRVEAERIAAKEHALLRTVLETLPEGVVVRDRDGRHLLANPVFLERIGLTDESQLIGRTVHEVFDAPLAAAIAAEDEAVLQRCGEPLRTKISRSPRKGLDNVWTQIVKIALRDADGTPYAVVGIGRDVTDEENAKRMLEHQAGHDALTGLPNRRTLLTRLEQALARGMRDCAVLYIDLDFFKTINDQFGHEFGDRLLIEVSRRIAARLSADDILARLGGDEFVALLAHCGERGSALDLAARILAEITEPIPIGSALARIEASIGIALARDADANAESLLRAADIAMYAAKEEGRNRAALFDETLRSRTARDAGLTQALQFALDRNELRLVYQPKYRLRDRRLEGFEALLRWDSAEFGSVPPMEFIEIAERSTLIRKIGAWVLSEACRQFRSWLDAHPALADATIGINVSMRQLLSDDFVEDVQHALEANRLPPSAVELEITETSVMVNPLQAQITLVRLKALGVRIALDDFGTGYSSLAYVRRLPLDTIKIDRAFVAGLAEQDGEAEIVRLVLTLSKTLGLRSVAEGIERNSVFEELQQLGCDTGQGYLFSPPLPARDIERTVLSAPGASGAAAGQDEATTRDDNAMRDDNPTRDDDAERGRDLAGAGKATQEEPTPSPEPEQVAEASQPA